MRLVEIYRAQAHNTLAIQLQYRVSLVIWMIGLVLNPVIYLVVWVTVAHSSGGNVGGYAAGDFAAYFILLMLVDHLTFTWIIPTFESRIRQGILSPLLLRPVHPIHADIVENATFKLLMLAVLLPAAALLSLAFHPIFHPTPWAVALFIPVIVLAIVLRFTVEWTVALISFWTSRMSAIDQMYFVIALFLSGQVAPLSLFPAPVRLLADALPFRWMIAFPVELLLGRVSFREALLGLGVQAIWLVVGLVGLRLLWKAGVNRYSAVGS